MSSNIMSLSLSTDLILTALLLESDTPIFLFLILFWILDKLKVSEA